MSDAQFDHWRDVALKRVVRFGYGDALSYDDREPGDVKVYGSNGAFAEHSIANTRAPCIVIGRKGSYGKLQFTDEPVFCVDTTFFVDERLTDQDLRFVYYLLSTLGLDQGSADSAVPGLSRDKAYSSRIMLPPLDTQRRIAEYLDDKTARIDALIEKKRALLDRLAEKRQALITRAVTRGLNPAAPLKDSGIDWLGKVPAHWEVKKLKYLTPKVSVGIVVTPANWYADEGILALRGLNIRPMGFDLQETRLISYEGHEFHAKSRLQKGDLVSVRTGDPGTTAVVTEEFDGCNCIDLVIIRRPADMLPRYLGWFLNSNVAKVQYQLGSEGALQAHFNVETSKETLIAVPSAAEQSAIVDHLEAALNAHDEAVSKITKSVEKLTEYRAALVTAAVTGKIRALLTDPAPAALIEEA